MVHTCMCTCTVDCTYIKLYDAYGDRAHDCVGEYTRNHTYHRQYTWHHIILLCMLTHTIQFSREVRKLVCLSIVTTHYASHMSKTSERCVNHVYLLYCVSMIVRKKWEILQHYPKSVYQLVSWFWKCIGYIGQGSECISHIIWIYLIFNWRVRYFSNLKINQKVYKHIYTYFRCVWIPLI